MKNPGRQFYTQKKFSIRDFWKTKTVKFKENAFSGFSDFMEQEKQIELSREESTKNETISMALQEGMNY